ncbi:hypothetical protein O988_05110 [Pseudogymnoascus sp. VKM F-3808]|nr:hypothetical protein O988_05110 [Pseudogymnoascus sp. VKM F-3808]
MFPQVFQGHCAACEATAAQWARINACPHSKEDLSTPGKPYPIPPTFGTDSHPYGKQIGFTEFMVAPEPGVSQDKVSTQPQYEPAVKKPVDTDYIKDLIANIFPPTPKPETNPGPMFPKPNVPIPLIVPPKYRLEGLEMGPSCPPPRPYVPTPPYESLFDSEPEDAIPKPRPNVPLLPDAPPSQGISNLDTKDVMPRPGPNVPLPPDALPNQSLSGPYPRPNVPLPPDAPPNQ